MCGRRGRPMVASMTPITEQTHHTARVDTGPWARFFAATYNPFLWAAELAGMRARRRELLALARGRTLELGSGTGLNLRHYPDDLDELILAEPAAPMRRRLQKAVRRSKGSATILDAAAEHLPVDDGSVDTVVSTLVLCTVDEPVAALDEVKRVLRPGGRLLFLEHVRSDSAWLARWQDRLERPWKRFAEGCRCNRATVEMIEAAGFSVGHRSDGTWHAMPAIVRPIVSGSATR
jgi:ubiquinone/menaquinone biosynthesis C-methylase UbiE